jgi:hypothetical protein
MEAEANTRHPGPQHPAVGEGQARRTEKKKKKKKRSCHIHSSGSPWQQDFNCKLSTATANGLLTHYPCFNCNRPPSDYFFETSKHRNWTKHQLENATGAVLGAPSSVCTTGVPHTLHLACATIALPYPSSFITSGLVQSSPRQHLSFSTTHAGPRSVRVLS